MLLSQRFNFKNGTERRTMSRCTASVTVSLEILDAQEQAGITRCGLSQDLKNLPLRLVLAASGRWADT
ncbi:hypothetical protein EV2_014265 [Malus domestica]